MEKLICPFCGKEEGSKNQHVSRFIHSESQLDMAKCHVCDKTWFLSDEHAQKRFPIMSIHTFCQSRRIPTAGIEDAPVRVNPWIKKDGTPSSQHALYFRFDSCSHVIGITGQGDKPFQKWEPTGMRKQDPSLWTYVNSKVNPADPGTLYLCEGEKDGLALGQNGFTFAAVPGATQFRPEHVEWIEARFPSIRRIRICFDCDPAGRLGTKKAIRALATRMSLALEVLKFPEGTPPGSDVGDILKHHGPAFARVFVNMNWVEAFFDLAKEPIESSKSAPEWVVPNQIQRRSDGYWEVKYDQDGEAEAKPFSNCVINVFRAYTTEEGVEYLVQVQNQKRKSGLFTMNATDFGDPTAFRKRLANHGAFHFWSSSTRILAAISEYETTKEGVAPVSVLDGYGYFRAHRFYAFPDMIVGDGRCYEADKDGLIQVDDRTYTVGTGFKFLGGSRPDFRLPAEPVDIPGLMREVVQHSAMLIGSGYAGLLTLGWFLSTFYSDLFFTRDLPWGLGKSFPYLHVIGKKGSGKTEGIWRFHGLTGYDAFGDSFEESTQDYLAKALYANRNLPMWLDEVSGGKAKIRPGQLKTVFNRASSGKGTLTGTRSLDCHGTLILSGEERMTEIADRSVIVTFPYESERTERNRTAFVWFTQNRRWLSTVAIEVMKHRTPDSESAYLGAVAQWIGILRESITGITDRLAQNYAVALSGLDLLSESVSEDVQQYRKEGIGAFRDWFVSELTHLLSIRKEDDIVSEGFSLYITQETPIFRREDTLHIPASTLKQRLQRFPNFNERQFLEALRSAPYYRGAGTSRGVPVGMVREGNQYVPGERKAVWCHHLDAAHIALPVLIREGSVQI